MPQSLRQLKTRIRSIEGIEKITRAMEMVAMSKLRSIESSAIASRMYILRMEGLLRNLLASFEGIRHPLLGARHDKKRVCLCLVTSDTGLCGGYNNLLIQAASSFIKKSGPDRVFVVAVGKKGLNYLKRSSVRISGAYTENYGRYSAVFSKEITKSLTGMFLSGEADEVYAAYTAFESAARRRVVVEKILNIELPGGNAVDYLTEPDAAGLIGSMALVYISAKVRDILLSSFVSEHSARALAMGEATNNARDLLDVLGTVKNKMRQAIITNEIIEVISAADALKG